MIRGAAISPCGAYRYRLWRQWGDGPSVAFIMLNPSTADAEEDDPTIRRCIGFAKLWGFDRLDVVNLFAYRATQPADMKRASNPVGIDNPGYIAATQRDNALTVCAWGTHGGETGREMIKSLQAPHALRMTKDGHPAHPLYLPAHLEPFRIGE